MKEHKCIICLESIKYRHPHPYFGVCPLETYALYGNYYYTIDSFIIHVSFANSSLWHKGLLTLGTIFDKMYISNGTYSFSFRPSCMGVLCSLSSS
jgi:hypothetical protein